MGWLKAIGVSVTVGRKVWKFLAEIRRQGKARLTPAKAKEDRRWIEDELLDFARTGSHQGLWALTDLDNDAAVYAQHVLKSRHIALLNGQQPTELRVKEILGQMFTELANLRVGLGRTVSGDHLPDAGKKVLADDVVAQAYERIETISVQIRDAIRVLDGTGERQV